MFCRIGTIVCTLFCSNFIITVYKGLSDTKGRQKEIRRERESIVTNRRVEALPTEVTIPLTGRWQRINLYLTRVVQSDAHQPQREHDNGVNPCYNHHNHNHTNNSHHRTFIMAIIVGMDVAMVILPHPFKFPIGVESVANTRTYVLWQCKEDRATLYTKVINDECTLIFVFGNGAALMLVGGFSRGIPVSPPLQSTTDPFPPHVNLTCAQDIVVERRPKPFSSLNCQLSENGAAPECKGGELEIPERTRRPAALSHLRKSGVARFTVHNGMSDATDIGRRKGGARSDRRRSLKTPPEAAKWRCPPLLLEAPAIGRSCRKLTRPDGAISHLAHTNTHTLRPSGLASPTSLRCIARREVTTQFREESGKNDAGMHSLLAVSNNTRNLVTSTTRRLYSADCLRMFKPELRPTVPSLFTLQCSFWPNVPLSVSNKWSMFKSSAFAETKGVQLCVKLRNRQIAFEKVSKSQFYSWGYPSETCSEPSEGFVCPDRGERSAGGRVGTRETSKARLILAERSQMKYDLRGIGKIFMCSEEAILEDWKRLSNPWSNWRIQPLVLQLPPVQRLLSAVAPLPWLCALSVAHEACQVAPFLLLGSSYPPSSLALFAIIADSLSLAPPVTASPVSPARRTSHQISDVSMEQRRNGRAEETGDPRENPPTSGIVRYDSHMRKSGSDTAGIESVLATLLRRLPGEFILAASDAAGARGQYHVVECLRGSPSAAGSCAFPPRVISRRHAFALSYPCRVTRSAPAISAGVFKEYFILYSVPCRRSNILPPSISPRIDWRREFRQPRTTVVFNQFMYQSLECRQTHIVALLKLLTILRILKRYFTVAVCTYELKRYIQVSVTTATVGKEYLRYCHREKEMQIRRMSVANTSSKVVRKRRLFSKTVTYLWGNYFNLVAAAVYGPLFKRGPSAPPPHRRQNAIKHTEMMNYGHQVVRTDAAPIGTLPFTAIFSHVG
ncbi:hypothetical protein PR048_003642 [Dryococelus australis]|uniref:Uncharacterized protein n=1 Tax=Dryococelus australis TaxID=614101 RepID=A0ABQ9IP80_9NEOP|nr:hypothetical protein PR048_003642 [Dryococelus australis]